MPIKYRTTYGKFRSPCDAGVLIGNRFGILPNSRFYGPQGHRGTDWRSAAHPRTYAIGGGKVVLSQWSAGLGHMVVIKISHPTRPFVGYAHLSRVDVKVGQTVKNGQLIGIAGDTGSLADGVHDHVTWGDSINSIMYGNVYDVTKLIGTNDPSTAKKEMIWKWVEPSATVKAGIVKELRRLHHLSTVAPRHDQFVRAIETFLAHKKVFGGVINGEATGATTTAIQKYGQAVDKGYDVDAILGQVAWGNFLKRLQSEK